MQSESKEIHHTKKDSGGRGKNRTRVGREVGEAGGRFEKKTVAGGNIPLGKGSWWRLYEMKKERSVKRTPTRS